jgi:hypothetical protein
MTLESIRRSVIESSLVSISLVDHAHSASVRGIQPNLWDRPGWKRRMDVGLRAPLPKNFGRVGARPDSGGAPIRAEKVSTPLSAQVTFSPSAREQFIESLLVQHDRGAHTHPYLIWASPWRDGSPSGAYPNLPTHGFGYAGFVSIDGTSRPSLGRISQIALGLGYRAAPTMPTTSSTIVRKMSRYSGSK